MTAELRVFLDTSVLFAAVLSETGGSRLILKLGEAGAVQLWVGQRVLQEADGVLARKAPDSGPSFALLLDRSRIVVGPPPDERALALAQEIVACPPDALILAEALAAEVDYLVSLDRRHLVENQRTSALPFPVGLPGDFLTWFRRRLTRERRARWP